MTAAMNEKLGAYKTHQHKNESDREIEARALLTCASQMDAVRTDGSVTKAYSEAVKRNQRLWTIFQVALCDPGNPLPVELKNILLNLSCYVDKVSFRALNEYKPQLLTDMIGINRSIATGLSKNPQGAAQPPAPPPAQPQGGSVATSA